MSAGKVGDDLETEVTVKGQRGSVVLLHCEDEIASLGEGLLEKSTRNTLAACILGNTKARDIHEAIIATHQDVSKNLVPILDHPTHTTMELVLKHSLRHGVGEEGFLEIK